MLPTIQKSESGHFKKSQQGFHGEKEGERVSAMRNTIIYDSENLGLEPINLAKNQLWIKCAISVV